MGKDHALRVARRPRRVKHDRGVRSRPLGDLRVEEPGIRRGPSTSALPQALVGREFRLRVMPQSARVVIPDVLELGALRHDLEQLVGLLLVLDDRVGDLRVLEDVDHFLGDGVLVERDGSRAERLRRGERPVEARPVRPDDRDVLAALEARLGEAACEPVHLVAHLAPGPALPDAQVLLANRGQRAAHLRMAQQELRERVGRPGLRGHGDPILLLV